MSVYRKFNRNDILFSTIHSRPRVSAKLGEHGWEGSTGVSASLSLYGGVRSRYDVRSSDFSTSGISIYPLDPLDTHSIDKVIFVSGSYPSTGSIRFARCKNQPFTSFLQVTDERWFEEHFRPIELLYEYYGRTDSNYFLGSHDFYSVLLLGDTGTDYLSGSYYVFSGAFTGSTALNTGSSWTIESWIKPLPVGTSSLTPFPHMPTWMSQKGIWNVFLDESGSLWLGLEQTSTGPSTNKVVPGEWNHTAVVVESGVSASFWINGEFGGKLQMSQVLNTGSDGLPLILGEYVSSDDGGHSYNLNGYIFETRVWTRALSGSEIQLNASGTLLSSGSSDLIHYARFNDGPFGTAHGFVSGSGAFDYSVHANHGYHVGYSDYHVPHWQPNDHPTFVTAHKRCNLDIRDIRVVHVPSMFYGRQIDPGSVVINDGAYNKRKIVRVFNDDGRGTLYVSGSYTRSISGEDYTGERRRKVGNVFYTEGLIVLTDPALYDVFDSGSIFWSPQMSVSGVFGDAFSVDFRGQTRMHTKVFNCRLPTAHVNASNNPTFSYVDDMGTEQTDDDRAALTRDDNTVYITAVGLYNEDRQLVAVAKLAQPVRKREKDKLNIKLKIDF